MSGTDVLMVRRGAEAVSPSIWTLGGQGNSLLVDHGEGLLLVDAGPGNDVTTAMIESVRKVSQKPLTHIVISHGHMGYNFGVTQWNSHAASRGEPQPVLVGHERVSARYRRYRETAGLQAYTNTRQFRTPYPQDIPQEWFIAPTLTYQTSLHISGSEREIVLLHAPSETDDATAVWVPSEGLLYGSCACISGCPNVGSPYRIARDPLRWAATLEKFLALRPRILVPEFGKPLSDAAEIDEALTVPVKAIHWLRKEVVQRMNQGMSENETLHDIDYPAELFGHKLMRPVYGCPDYMVREIWRMENGWWDRNPTHLHPAPAIQVATEVLELIGDPAPVLGKCRALAKIGQLQMALHLVDLLALGPAQHPSVMPARHLKSELLRARAAQMTSTVSRQLMQSEADVLVGIPIGSCDANAAGFSWI